jgi:ribonuclease HII
VRNDTVEAIRSAKNGSKRAGGPLKRRPAAIPASLAATPDRCRERQWQACGYQLVAGIDEVGRGPIAGPVVAGAVILPLCEGPEGDGPAWIGELRDSKLLTAAQRETLAAAIWEESVAAAVGFVEVDQLDALGIAPAARLAMRRAVCALKPRPDALLLDAFPLPEVELPQEAVIKGDRRCCAIAAASIIAKVARDSVMQGLALQYPGYGFERHVGYATAAHLEALQRRGPSAIHRRSFAPLRLELPPNGGETAVTYG